MLLAPSPTKASVCPASAPTPPRCCAIVSRSASTWHGWNSSVSELTTGTPASRAISSRRSCAWVRQTIAATCRPRTRAVSAIDSRTPILARLPSTTSGNPPSSAIPVVKETCVRSVGLSKITATARGPARGVRMNRSSRKASASSRTSRCSRGVSSSSRRKWRTISALRFEVVRQPCEECRERGRLLGGEDERRREAQHSRRARVDDEARVERTRRDLSRDRAGELDRDQQALTASLDHQRVLERDGLLAHVHDVGAGLRAAVVALEHPLVVERDD